MTKWLHSIKACYKIEQNDWNSYRKKTGDSDININRKTKITMTNIEWLTFKKMREKWWSWADNKTIKKSSENSIQHKATE